MLVPVLYKNPFNWLFTVQVKEAFLQGAGEGLYL